MFTLLFTLLFSPWFFEVDIQSKELAKFIERLDSLKEHLRPIPLQNTTEYIIPQDSVDAYICQFDKLRFTSRKAKVRCYYRKEWLGGEPYLYIHRNNAYDLSKKGRLNIRWLEKYAAKNFVQPIDDSPEACFQYLIFCEYGKLFALSWHALYDRKKIFTIHPSVYCVKKQEMIQEMLKEKKRIVLEELRKDLDDELLVEDFAQQIMLGYEFEYENDLDLDLCRGDVIDGEFYRETLEKGLGPKILADGDWYIVTLFEDNHETFVQKTYKVQRKKPWKIELANEHVMICKSSRCF